MKEILKLMAHRKFDVIKHDFSYSQINQYFLKNIKKKEYFFKSINIIPKKYSSIGKSNYFTISDTIEKDIEWALIALKFNIGTINKFIEIERIIFRNIFLGEYTEALINIDYLNSNISFSQWSILMKMTIYYLKGDEDSLTVYTNDLLENEIESQTVRETIFLHYKKLTKDITEKKDFNILISDLEFQLNTRESIFIREHTKDVYEREIYHQLLSVEKYATSPFNRKTQKETIKYLITLSYEYSIVDLYKTFSMVISELQTENSELDKKVLNEVYNLFPKTNLVKLNSEYQIHNYNSTKKLFYTYELYLCGEFKRVIKISKKHLIKYPYDIDYLYFLVNSATYLEVNPLDSFKDLSNDSLLYKIIFNYYNLINNLNFRI